MKVTFEAEELSDILIEMVTFINEIERGILVADHNKEDINGITRTD